MSTPELIAAAKRIVIKVGSSSITGENSDQLDVVVDLCARLMASGKEVILVSSGAIATASPMLGLTVKPEDLATSQALASIGQAKLMSRYEKSLARHHRIPGQVLLTVDNLEQPVSSTNALHALERLLELEVLPVINENDSVATQEIRFGDNDQLAARVSALVSADLLILFSDIDSLYSKHPSDPEAKRIETVAIDEDLSWIQVSGTSTGYGTGGALTKLSAAKNAANHRVGVILTLTGHAAKLDSAPVIHTWFEPAN